MASVFQKCKQDEKNRHYPCGKGRCGHPWTVRFREPGGRSGRQREKTFPTKTEAANYGIKVENDKREQIYIDPERGKVPVRVYAHEWLERQAVKAGTREGYRHFIDYYLIPALGSKTMAGVQSSDIEKLCIGMRLGGLAHSSVYGTHMVPLRALFRSAVNEKIIAHSPVAAAKLPKAKTKRVDERNVPDAKAIGVIISHVREDWRVSVWLMAGCGLRLGEALGVKPDDITDGVLRIRRQAIRIKRDGRWVMSLEPLKGREEGEWRDVPVALAVHAAVVGHHQRFGVGAAGTLVHAGNGNLAYDVHFRAEFRKAVVAAGFVDKEGKPLFTPHGLRHFFATEGISKGISLVEMSRWLGHASIQITADIYGHLSPDARDRLVAIMDGSLTSLGEATSDAVVGPADGTASEAPVGQDGVASVMMA
ncbi:site-specific integrase [Streptomyces sp. TRM66268-LWL]|uniref:Site-specific integrase n=1 Tax=Streptomyces polyasparticus TaxID=2767826 RepID=A0ABR7SSM2_9ACTN|nr:tyrosine-type recombinase/integrase [Streptomyces polyasparticus]MBC9718459.1 site-specific integrase [Streptomyces polyasparticus]